MEKQNSWIQHLHGIGRTKDFFNLPGVRIQFHEFILVTSTHNEIDRIEEINRDDIKIIGDGDPRTGVENGSRGTSPILYWINSIRGLIWI